MVVTESLLLFPEIAFVLALCLVQLFCLRIYIHPPFVFAGSLFCIQHVPRKGDSSNPQFRLRSTPLILKGVGSSLTDLLNRVESKAYDLINFPL